ncbi:MAG: ATP-dependent DNA helicase [Planctomycetota bacterium]|jgi:ATP-dependent DNA helicase DinG
MIKANTSLQIEEVFGPEGHLGQSFNGFESRGQQVEMAKQVQKTLRDSGHLVIEAGTGVGKSFAYLVPAREAASRGAGGVLVSTFTITLQEQLINKDIPFLADCLPWGFTAVLAKGRGNYICKRRLKFALKRRQLFPDKLGGELDAVSAWASRTKDGSLSDMDYLPSATVWEKVRSEHGNCRSRRCPYFKDCFYQKARRQLDSADIIVANHALMFSDLVLKEQGASILPEYKFVVVDEAHNIESVAEEHFGINVSNRGIKLLADELYNPRTKKGLLAYKNQAKAIGTLNRVRKNSGNFFKQVGIWYESMKAESNGRCFKNFVDDSITEPIKKLRSQLSGLANATDDVDEQFEIMRYVNRCAVLAGDLDNFLNQHKSEYVYWVERSAKRGNTIHLRSAPTNVGDDVKRVLFDEYETVVMTSATLSVDGTDEKKGFEFFAGRVGLEDYNAVKLGSPFDYQRQVTLYIEKDMPDPNEKEFIVKAAEAIKRYLLKTDARAFVLFTSYSMMDGVAGKIYEWLLENDIELLQQGAGIDRSTLLKKFREKTKAVLFGTDSFWQGVDVPGEALSNVIIVKLPFAVPDRPLLAGKLERIRQNGGNPFFDYQLPLAVIKFKQGFGRLIRTKTDTGIIAVLDSRIINKRYGQMFLGAIPKCTVKIQPGR